MKQTLEQSRPGLWKHVGHAVRLRELSARTQHLYLHWIERFVVFHDLQDPAALSRSHVTSFLDHLRYHWQVSRAGLNQAVMALAFLYEEVLKLPQAFSLGTGDSLGSIGAGEEQANALDGSTETLNARSC